MVKRRTQKKVNRIKGGIKTKVEKVWFTKAEFEDKLKSVEANEKSALIITRSAIQGILQYRFATTEETHAYNEGHLYTINERIAKLKS